MIWNRNPFCLTRFDFVDDDTTALRNTRVIFVSCQVFLHATTSKKQAMQLKMRNIEWWMRKRHLPQGFRQRVRNYERQRWAAMRGVDECEMIRNLPEGLRRDIKYHLCLDLVRQVMWYIYIINKDQTISSWCVLLKPLFVVSNLPCSVKTFFALHDDSMALFELLWLFSRTPREAISTRFFFPEIIKWALSGRKKKRRWFLVGRHWQVRQSPLELMTDGTCLFWFQVPLFQHMDDLVLENICDRVKSLIFTKGETVSSATKLIRIPSTLIRWITWGNGPIVQITREGDPVQRMLFVVRGHLQSSQVLRDGVKSCCMLGPGNFSGDELLSWCLRRPFIERLPPSSSTLVTLETTEAFGLEAEDVKYVTQHFRYAADYPWDTCFQWIKAPHKPACSNGLGPTNGPPWTQNWALPIFESNF